VLSEFKTFILRGNVVDLAIGVIIGGAFGKIVSSLVDDVIMPPIGALLGRVDFANLMVVIAAGSKASPPYESVKAAKEAGAVVLGYGQFINTVISFLIVGVAMFIVVKSVSRLMPPPPADQRDCPLCLSKIPNKATKCSHCTSSVQPVG
jgi:large conductance mechanosensitive channel